MFGGLKVFEENEFDMPYSKIESAVPDPDAVIWRYMDGWKFEDLVGSFSDHESWQPAKSGARTVYFNEPEQLWFAFPGSFGDPREGTFPTPNDDPSEYCDRMAQRIGLSVDEARLRKERFLSADTATLRDGTFFMAQLCGVSCWHANVDESYAMWKTFVGETHTVGEDRQ